jgi:hypothetical protein
VVEINYDILLSVANNHEEASFLLLQDVSMACAVLARHARTWAPFRINAGIRESL